MLNYNGKKKINYIHTIWTH